MSSIPSSAKSKQLRACLLCSIIQTPSDFRKHGCPNCEEILELQNSPANINACTTTSFEGVISVIDPDNSWVARWQRTSKYAKGMYAARVKGHVPEEIETKLENRGIKYRPRDQTEQD